MAVLDYGTDLDLLKVSQLLNARVHNVTTIQRTALAVLLSAANEGLHVWDVTENITYYWNGASWTNGTAPTTPPVWGNITGTLSNQTDLQAALNTKANSSALSVVAFTGHYTDLIGLPSLATVATTGDYNDLSNKPTIPPATTPAGANHQVQFNNSGAFGASTSFLWDESTKSLTVGIASGNGLIKTYEVLFQDSGGNYGTAVSTKIIGNGPEVDFKLGDNSNFANIKVNAIVLPQATITSTGVDVVVGTTASATVRLLPLGGDVYFLNTQAAGKANIGNGSNFALLSLDTHLATFATDVLINAIAHIGNTFPLTVNDDTAASILTLRDDGIMVLGSGSHNAQFLIGSTGNASGIYSPAYNSGASNIIAFKDFNGTQYATLDMSVTPKTFTINADIYQPWAGPRFIGMQFADGTQYKMGMINDGNVRELQFTNIANGEAGTNIAFDFKTSSGPTANTVFSILRNGSVNTTSIATDSVVVNGSNSSRSSIIVNTSNSTGNASFYFQNDRATNFTGAYGGLVTWGSAAPSSFFSDGSVDKTMLISDGANSRGLTIGTITAQPLSFGTDNTFRAVIDSIGNFGIGTTSPVSKFHIFASPGVAKGFTLELGSTTADPSSYTSIDFKVPTTGLIGQFFATAADYVNPAVAMGPNSIGLLSEDNNGFLLLGAGGTNGIVNIITGGYGTSNVRMQIIANGNVLIGTTTDQGVKLLAQSSVSGGLAFQVNNLASGYGGYISTGGSNSGRFIFRADYNNTAGTFAAGTAAFTVSDNGVVNHGVTQDLADNTAALGAGLVAGDIYRTGDILKIVH